MSFIVPELVISAMVSTSAVAEAQICTSEIPERVAFSQAPKGVRRPAAHVLEVSTKAGAKRFIDSPPHNEGGMSGVHWRYCGYVPQSAMHLIGRSDQGLFTGDLMSHETGNVIRAGHTVLFSQDGTAFLAIEQESGVDGEHWAVSDSNGTIRWKGYAGTVATANGVDVVVSTFVRPQWNAQGTLVAKYICSSTSASGEVRLTYSNSGRWVWSGQKKCS